MIRTMTVERDGHTYVLAWREGREVQLAQECADHVRDPDGTLCVDDLLRILSEALDVANL